MGAVVVPFKLMRGTSVMWFGGIFVVVAMVYLVVILPLTQRLQLNNAIDHFIENAIFADTKNTREYWDSAGVLFGDIGVLREIELLNGGMSSSASPGFLKSGLSNQDKIYFVREVNHVWPDTIADHLLGYSFYRDEMVSVDSYICREGKCSYYFLVGENKGYLLVVRN
ncbi:hypothetical protein DS901_02635 [Loktanella sp. D2R18]|nr:hypothetical protein DS901_02635 [Loktanella sp. D2R18]